MDTSKTCRLHAQWVAGVGGIVSAHLIAATIFQFVSPYVPGAFPTCAWLKLTGLQCPMCGGTRALYSLLSGDIVSSFLMNPLLIATYVAGGLILGQVAVEVTSGRQLRWPFRLAIASVSVAALYTGVLRNLI